MAIRISFIWILSLTFLKQNVAISQIDSLKSQLEVIQDDSIRFELLFNLSKEYQNINVDSSLRYSQLALDQAKLNSSFNQSLSAINSVAIAYYRQGNTTEALKLFMEGLELSEEHNIMEMRASYTNNIGNIYTRVNKYDLALEYFRKALVLNDSLDNKKGIANAYNNIGIVYKSLDSVTTAIFYINKAIAIRAEIDDKDGLIDAYNNIANAYANGDNWPQAEVYLMKAAELCSATSNYMGLAATYGNLSNVYEERKQYETAMSFALKGMQVAKEHGLRASLKNIYTNVIRGYKNLGNYKMAYEVLDEYFWYHDSLKELSSQEDIARQEAQHEIATKELINQKLREKNARIEAISKHEKKEKELSQEALNASKKSQQFLIAVLVLAAAIVIVIVVMLRKIKKTYKLVQEKNVLVEASNIEIKKQKQEADRQREIVEEKNKEITDSINYAKRIQSAILPPNKLVKEYLQECFILYRPKDIVAGDFYWLESFAQATDSEGANKSSVLFAAADCTGHGVPGAMVSVVCNNGLNRSVREYGLHEPGKILDKTREIVISEFEKSEEEVKDGMDIALCALDGSTLKYAGAHNPLWIIRKDSQEIEEIKADKQPIGKYDDPMPYTTHTIELNRGDSFYIFTDGFADQFGGDKGKKLKAKNFKQLLLSIQEESMEHQRELIDEAFENWRGNFEQLDDVCVIGVRVSP